MPDSRATPARRPRGSGRLGGPHGSLAALVVACAAGCPSPAAGIRRDFSPHELVARGSEVDVELVSAGYGENTVPLALTIRNRGQKPLHVDARSVLLELEQLEYAPVTAPAVSLVPAGQTVSMTLEFAIGRPFHGPATVQLQHLRQGQRWLPDMTLEIPPRQLPRDQAAANAP